MSSSITLSPIVLSLVLAIASAGAPAAASAQVASADSARTASGDTIRLEAVEVSVLRTPIRLSDAPLAISVRGVEELGGARSGAFLEEVLRGLPGVQVQNRFNPAVGERIAIRGFGARAQFGVRGVRILVDGIPATLPDGQSTVDHLDIGSLGRVEAIRGPASALYGNASGGVLSFSTRAPASEPVRIGLETVGGSHGLQRGQLTASGTAGRTGYLVTASSLRWDGYRSIPGEGTEDTYGQSERWGLNARVIRPVGDGEFSLTVNAVDLDAENPGSLDEDDWQLESRPASTGNLDHQTGKQVQQQQIGLRWQGAPEEWNIDLATFWIGRDVVNPIPFNVIDLSRDAFGLRTQAGRSVRTDRGEIRWAAGFEADLQLDDRLNFRNQQGSRGDLTLDQEETVRGLGLFGQVTLPLAGWGELMAGLRWDRHDFEAVDRFPREGDDPDATGRRAMDAWSPSIGVHLPVSGTTDFFASIGSVFETPSTTELANRPDGAGGFNPDLEPQTGTSGELGLRGRIDGVGSWEVTGYRTNLRNELVPFEIQGRTYFRNSGSSYHQGLEATVAARLVPGLFRAEATYSWTDARFRSYELDGEALDGNRIPGVAPHRAHLLLGWTPGEANVELSGNYLHAVPVNDTNTAEAPSHLLWDLRGTAPRLRLGTDDGVSLEPWVALTNLFDERYTASVVVNAFGGRYFEPGPGRSLQLGLRASWGGGE